jgi:hypothetical protein
MALGIRVYRGSETRITLRSIWATTMRDGRGSEPIRYRRVARGVWLWVSGFIVARKPGLRFAPSGLRRCGMVAARNRTDTALLTRGVWLWVLWVYRDPETRLRFAPSGLRRYGMVAARNRTDTALLTRGVWLWVSGFIVARKPGLRFAPSGLRRSGMDMERNPSQSGPGYD